MSKFRNKYRIESVRLEGYDYGRNGAYFITICTNNRQHFFGEIRESEFFPTDLGNLAEKFWLEIPDKFPFVELGNFVVMPDHTHGILVIDKNDPVETRLIADQPVDQINGGFAGIKNPMFHENISRIIRWYKGRCAFEMRKIDPGFAWQSSFYDHIIRNAKSFENIQNYIKNNPSNWAKDKLKG